MVMLIQSLTLLDHTGRKLTQELLLVLRYHSLHDFANVFDFLVLILITREHQIFGFAHYLFHALEVFQESLSRGQQ